MAELIVALDYTDSLEAISVAGQLRLDAPWLKVGMELFTAEGPRIIQTFKGMGFKVMLDLKFFDIPNTVRGGIRAACAVGVDLITLHVLGGERMIRAAVDEADIFATQKLKRPLLFGVTVPTSMEEGELPGYAGNLGVLAVELAVDAQNWGLNGVVCSGYDVPAIKKCAPNLLCLTPGIRLEDSPADDQRRTMSPSAAVAAGSDFLVVGRPITKAKDPAKVALTICRAMSQAKK